MIRLFILIFVFIGITLNTGPVYSAKGDIAAIATQVVGKVNVLVAKIQKNQPCRAGMFLYEGDELKTDKISRVVLTFLSGSEVKVGSNS